MDDAVHWMVFFETGHALHLGTDKTEDKLCLFRRCAPAQVIPMFPNGGRIQVGDFAEGKLKAFDSHAPSFLCSMKRLLENGLGGLKFAHCLHR
jgi:hypothetical protein